MENLKIARRQVEDALLEQYGSSTSSDDAGTIFVLGSPRTGSTFLYQALCSRFRMPYIANLTNDLYPDAPMLGLSLQKSVAVEVNFESAFGKTEGAFQPSEGSAVMANWFGGGHPSALVSNEIKACMEEHFLRTLGAAESLFGAPLVIKNAWNCFRLPYLANVLPCARFIWIRRDLVAAAKSDLAARYETKGTATAWNSATPANIDELKSLPPAGQVVENQYEFNRVVGDELESGATGRWHEIWYEDLIADPESCLAAMGQFLNVDYPLKGSPIQVANSYGARLGRKDDERVEAYAATHADRLAPFRRHAPQSLEK